jgi:hypothetical protein
MALCKPFIAITTSKFSLDRTASASDDLSFVARNRGVGIATVNRSSTPNLSLKRDAPPAALRARGGSPLSFVR